MSAKKTTVAMLIPQSREQAIEQLKTFVDTGAAVDALEARRTKAIARITTRYEARLKALQTTYETLFKGLQLWAIANRKVLTDDGKTKQVKLGVAAIGWRACPPSVKWAKDFNADKIVAAIRDLVGRPRVDIERDTILLSFIRTKEEPNKEAMLDNPELAKKIDGVRIGSAGEVFYIDPTITDTAEAKS